METAQVDLVGDPFGPQPTDEDFAELERYLDEQEAAWFASLGIDVAGELTDLQEGIADEDYWRSGC